MIPNKTEEQILYQQFKFYDLDASGQCNLQNFIKTNDRLGVVLPRLENFEIIFNYFSDPETSLLNYRKFIKEIFNFKSTNEIIPTENNVEMIPENDFINILTRKIIERGGTFPLIELVKNLQMADFEGNKRMNIDNFLKAVQRCKIFLNKNEIQTLFNEYDIYENGIVKYQILINIILEQFWDDEKLSLSEQIYYLLTGNGRRSASLNILKNYFEQILMDSIEKKFFIQFINEYKTINKVSVSQTMNLKELVYFLDFYNFGKKSNKYLIELINILKNEEQKNILNKNNFNNKQSGFKRLMNKQKQNEKEGAKINNYLGENYENPKINEINAKLREKFVKFGRKTFFNFLKHFKFYDNKTNHISKYDFSKILKNFNIKLSIDEIDEIFKNYGIDKIKNSMNYELFLNDLILGYTPKHRQNAINYLYDILSKKEEINISFLKQNYNAKNNYFQKDEGQNRIEFEECLDLYHYSYNGFKNDSFSKKEFCFFYYYISLLMPSDEEFFYLLSNEWGIPMHKINNMINNINNSNDEYNENVNNLKNNLDMLKISEKKFKKNLSDMSRFANLGEKIQDYQHSIHSGNENDNFDYNEENEDESQNNKNKNNLIHTKINKEYTKEDKEKALSLLSNILLKRGLRGILYLYSQFLSFCQDINKITFNDFTIVFKIQHIDLDINTIKKIFKLFSIKNNGNENDEEYLDFYSFIRTYKKELNQNKLNVVEQAFTIIDEKGEDRVPLDVIKMRYNPKNHPDVEDGKYTEDGKILEFLDCFSMCYEILKMDNKKYEDEECVDFEIFANFYEYVSFLYPRDKDFEYIVSSTWN